MSAKNTFGIKRPGIEKERAKRAGISVHAELEKDAKSKNPTRKKEGVLGLTFQRKFKKKKTVA